MKAPFARRSVAEDGPATGDNPAYVSWLLSQSMLADANEISQQFSGQGSMWQNPFANPNPRAAVDAASVWFTAYPLSLITRPDESFLQRHGRRGYVEGVRGDRHRGDPHRPREAGRRASPDGSYTPSVDGHFDRISTQIDPAFGTEDEFRHDVRAPPTGTAARSSTTSCPGHTGKGADFRLAEMKYADYPGIYHMVEIDPRDWDTCPTSPPGRTRSTSTSPPRNGWTRPVTSSAACSG